jgi:threonine/homoserine/homoserine lactone efflux protein
MLGVERLEFFLAAGLLLNITPGPDTLYILARSIAQGRKAGVASALGIATGSLGHTAAAAFGLSALLATSAVAFGAIKLAGAVYLIYLGLSLLLRRPREDAPHERLAPQNLWVIYRQGALTNLLNPKVALFFLAFLPQFINPASANKVPAFLFLGVLFTFNGTLWCLVLAWFASALSRSYRGNPGTRWLLRKATGGLFVGLGCKLAFNR